MGTVLWNGVFISLFYAFSCGTDQQRYDNLFYSKAMSSKTVQYELLYVKYLK